MLFINQCILCIRSSQQSEAIVFTNRTLYGQLSEISSLFIKPVRNATEGNDSNGHYANVHSARVKRKRTRERIAISNM